MHFKISKIIFTFSKKYYYNHHFANIYSLLLVLLRHWRNLFPSELHIITIEYIYIFYIYIKWINMAVARLHATTMNRYIDELPEKK